MYNLYLVSNIAVWLQQINKLYLQCQFCIMSRVSHCVVDYTVTAIELVVMSGVVFVATVGLIHFVRLTRFQLS